MRNKGVRLIALVVSIVLTYSGKEEARERHNIVVEIPYHLFDEENAKEWTIYLDNYLKEVKK